MIKKKPKKQIRVGDVVYLKRDRWWSYKSCAAWVTAVYNDYQLEIDFIVVDVEPQSGYVLGEELRGYDYHSFTKTRPRARKS